MLRLHAALGWRTVLPVHGAAMPSSHDHSKPGRPTGTREAWIEMLHEDRGDLDSVLQEQYVAPVGGELLFSPQSVKIIKFGDPGSGR